MRSQFRMRRGQRSSGAIQQLSKRPLDVDAVAESGDAQLHVIVLGEGREVRAFDLVLLEALAVLGQADALQPVAHVVFIPQVEGPLPPRPQGQQGPAEDRGGAGGSVGRRRGRAGSGSCTGASHDEADLLGFRGEAEAGRLQDGQAATRAQVGPLGAGGGQTHRPVRGGGRRGGTPAGDGVAGSRSDRVAGAESSLGDGVELAEAREQPVAHEQDISLHPQELSFTNTVPVRTTARSLPSLQATSTTTNY